MPVISGGGGNAPQVVTRRLTSTQLLALTDAAPITLVPGVAGVLHAVVDTLALFTVGGVQYANGADLDLVTGTTAGGWYTPVLAALVVQGASSVLSTGSATKAGWIGWYGGDNPPTQLVGQPLQLALSPATAPNTPFSAGTGTAVVWVRYYDLQT